MSRRQNLLLSSIAKNQQTCPKEVKVYQAGNSLEDTNISSVYKKILVGDSQQTL